MHPVVTGVRAAACLPLLAPPISPRTYCNPMPSSPERRADPPILSLAFTLPLPFLFPSPLLFPSPFLFLFPAPALCRRASNSLPASDRWRWTLRGMIVAGSCPQASAGIVLRLLVEGGGRG